MKKFNVFLSLTLIALLFSCNQNQVEIKNNVAFTVDAQNIINKIYKDDQDTPAAVYSLEVILLNKKNSKTETYTQEFSSRDKELKVSIPGVPLGDYYVTVFVYSGEELKLYAESEAVLKKGSNQIEPMNAATAPDFLAKGLDFEAFSDDNSEALKDYSEFDPSYPVDSLKVDYLDDYISINIVSKFLEDKIFTDEVDLKPELISPRGKKLPVEVKYEYNLRVNIPDLSDNPGEYIFRLTPTHKKSGKQLTKGTWETRFNVGYETDCILYEAAEDHMSAVFTTFNKLETASKTSAVDIIDYCFAPDGSIYYLTTDNTVKNSRNASFDWYIDDRGTNLKLVYGKGILDPLRVVVIDGNKRFGFLQATPEGFNDTYALTENKNYIALDQEYDGETFFAFKDDIFFIMETKSNEGSWKISKYNPSLKTMTAGISVQQNSFFNKITDFFASNGKLYVSYLTYNNTFGQYYGGIRELIVNSDDTISLTNYPYGIANVYDAPAKLYFMKNGQKRYLYGAKELQTFAQDSPFFTMHDATADNKFICPRKLIGIKNNKMIFSDSGFITTMDYPDNTYAWTRKNENRITLLDRKTNYVSDQHIKTDFKFYSMDYLSKEGFNYDYLGPYSTSSYPSNAFYYYEEGAAEPWKTATYDVCGVRYYDCVINSVWTN